MFVLITSSFIFSTQEEVWLRQTGCKDTDLQQAIIQPSFSRIVKFTLILNLEASHPREKAFSNVVTQSATQRKGNNSKECKIPVA